MRVTPLSYDFENRATRIVKKTTGLPTTYDTLWFNYCGQGKRISKIEKPNGGSPDTTSYAYDGMYAVCEFGGHLDLQYKYIYANGVLLARYDASAADSHYYHHDGLGSVMGMTDESGNVEQSYFYDEFGNSLGSYGSVSNHYLYTGQEYDGDISSLYNLRARYYDMSVGRFVQEDPIGHIVTKNPINLNPYIYVSDNPINYIDPSGKDKEQCKPEQVNQELANINAAYYFCLRRLPYSWGPIENFKWLSTWGRRGHACGDFVSAVMGCIYQQSVVGPCCELRYQSLVVHALLTVWCRIESESYRYKRFYDPWAQKIFPY